MHDSSFLRLPKCIKGRAEQEVFQLYVSKLYVLFSLTRQEENKHLDNMIYLFMCD